MRNVFAGKPEVECVRIVGGRLHHNSVRRLRATLRRKDVAALLFRRYSQADIARRLHVHRSTISRDVAQIWADARAASRCPVCQTELTGRPEVSEEVARAL